MTERLFIVALAVLGLAILVNDGTAPHALLTDAVLPFRPIWRRIRG